MVKTTPRSVHLVSSPPLLMPPLLVGAFVLSFLITGPAFAAGPVTGVITTLAGTGTYGFGGDGAAATAADMRYPTGVAVDAAGNVYIADRYNSRIRKVNAATGIITTVAGSSSSGFAGDGGAATAARLSSPRGVAVDGAGNLYIADTENHRVRKVTAATGVITTVAGSGSSGFGGDGGAATAAQLYYPRGVAVDGAGNLYIADTDNNRVRKVTATTDVITTVAGSGTYGFSGDGAAAFAAQMRSPFAVAVDGAGNLYISDTDNNRVRKVTAATGVITTVVGSGTSGYSGEAGAATSAALNSPLSVAVDGAGNLYIADFYNDRIRKVTAATGLIFTVAGSGTSGFGGDGGAATAAQLYNPTGTAVDGAGNLFIADSSNNRVRKVTAPSVPALLMTTLAGTGTYGFGGDGAAATAADMRYPSDVAVDAAGNVYIADYYNHRIRKVNAATGIITTVAGSSSSGFGGDGGAATAARLSYPSSVVVDGAGNLYISDTSNHRVRKVTAATGVITTVAGSGTSGFGGDGGTATAAQLYNPNDVAVDGAGNFYIADTSNNRVRKVTAATGVITTVAGDGTYSFSGDGAAAFAAQMRSPSAVAVDGAGNLFIADTDNYRVRKVTAATGVITTVAGSGTSGFSGEAGAATSAALRNTTGVAVDGEGNLYITDTYNHRVRKVTAATGLIFTVAGGGTSGFGGDGGAATAAQLYNPTGTAVDGAGNLYIADYSNNRVRAATLTIAPTITTQPTSQTVAAGQNAQFTVAASGSPTPTLQWQVSANSGSTWTNLTDTAPYSGSATATLTAASVPVSLTGSQYRAVATNSVGTATSNAATLTVTPCTYGVSPTSASFTASGGTGSFSVTAETGCMWTATPSPSFVTISSGGSGTGNGTVTYAVAAGTAARTGTITVGGQTFTVTQSGLPTLSLAPSTVNFGVVNNGGTLGFATPAQSLSLTQSGTGTVTWTAAANQSWITLSPASGSGPATIGVSINNTGNVLPLTGTLSGTVTVTTAGGANNPTAAVNLTVFIGSQVAPATGAFDTPTNGQTGITGSIAVTGWVVDDVGLSAVRILRDPVAGEGSQIFIGNAVFVRGARPDIATLNPTKPFYDRAGWGYLMLTNFLPSQGNGTFTLYAYADDLDGHTTLLGTKTITCTNATATAPFGALDTPDQGGTVSGSFVNFGWALAGQPASSGRLIPTNGSTVQVYIDSALLGTVDSYNNARTDIQALFPGYANTNGAIGVKTINSSTLANGVHTIFWIVTDNLGAAQGIGSRFFTVSNSSLMSGVTTQASDGQSMGSHVIDAMPRVRGAASALEPLPSSASSVAVTHGFAEGALPELAAPDHDGVRHVRTAQLERIEIDLAAARDDDHAVYRGYTRDGDTLRDLPIGSHLDAETGKFAWAPGLAFGGRHDLVFVKTCAHGSEQIKVHVDIDAQSSSSGDPRLVIDIPGASATLAQPFTVAGWALDPNGPANGPGIDTLHVWAYPVGGGDPRWVGVAAYGGLRSDVGDLFGPRFARSGFGIEVAGLAPGTYDLVVYAHSIATDAFSIARTVRMTVADR